MSGADYTIRPSRDADVPAITAIYGYHVLHGVASFEEVPPDAAEIARRRGDRQARPAVSCRRARRTLDRLLLCRAVPAARGVSFYGRGFGLCRGRRDRPRPRPGPARAGDRGLQRTRLPANGGGDRWPRDHRL